MSSAPHFSLGIMDDGATEEAFTAEEVATLVEMFLGDTRSIASSGDAMTGSHPPAEMSDSDMNVVLNASAGGMFPAEELIPMGTIAKLMADCLPAGVRVSHDAKENLQNSVTEFIGFVSSEAEDICRRSTGGTVTEARLEQALHAVGTRPSTLPASPL